MSDKRRNEGFGMERCLITGCEGFIGSYLAELLLDKGLLVYGTTYGSTENIDHLKDKITLLKCDMRDRKRVEDVVNLVEPDFVFHLAAQSSVEASWENPADTLGTNVLGTFYLLDSIRRADIDPLVEVVGSSAEYGFICRDELPMKEDLVFRPTSIYAVSKGCCSMLGYFHWKAHGMRIIRVRPFNMTGPRKTHDACSDFCRGIVDIERGVRKVLEVGNLKTIRDFTDGRDAVKALWLLAQKGKAGDAYNLCSCKSYRIGEILDMLITLSKRKIRVRQVPKRMRPFDDPIYLGDNSKLIKLGWRPEIPMEKTLTDMLDYWRKTL